MPRPKKISHNEICQSRYKHKDERLAEYSIANSPCSSVSTVTRSTRRPSEVLGACALSGAVSFSRMGLSILHGPHQLESRRPYSSFKTNVDAKSRTHALCIKVSKDKSVLRPLLDNALKRLPQSQPMAHSSTDNGSVKRTALSAFKKCSLWHAVDVNVLAAGFAFAVLAVRPARWASCRNTMAAVKKEGPPPL